MQRPPALPLGPAVLGVGTPLRRFGIASRAAQSLGIEYLDSFKKALDDLGATWEALAAARSPTEILA
ncbi:phasin family protein, partial [Escherichia coli]|nr:phasin family protein [Escherichia coli]